MNIADELRDMGYNPRSYSGRGMMGKRCVAIVLEGGLWQLAWRLGDHGIDLPEPRTDNLGFEIIAYWPDEAWEPEFNT